MPLPHVEPLGRGLGRLHHDVVSRLGWRLGGVLGEDAIELSQRATICTANRQAQERIGGSLPVPPDPSNPTPISG